MILNWCRTSPHTLPLPKRAHAGDAGLDLAVIVDRSLNAHGVGYREETGEIVVYPGALVNFETGFAVEIPPGFYGQVAVRSSIGKARWFLASSGVIDSGYRGTIMAPLLYLGAEPYTVAHGARMVQMLVLPVPSIQCHEVTSLSPSPRGTGGFGSTS